MMVVPPLTPVKPEEASLAGDDAVSELRRRFQQAVSLDEPSPEARAWRVGRFEHGLRIARELNARGFHPRGRRILDVGAAYGGEVAALCGLGASCVLADKFDYQYDRLRSTLDLGPRLDVQLFDCTRPWPVSDRSFDVVLCLAIVEHVDDLDAFFRELLRVLVPGGIALIETAPALRNARRDNLYHLPLTALLPTPLRRFVAERVFGRRYPFHISRHTFYSAGKFAGYGRRHGFRVEACKYASSRALARLGRWPAGRAWQWLLRRFMFDFVLLRPTGSRCRGRQPSGRG